MMHRLDDAYPARQRGMILGALVVLGCSLVLAAKPAQDGQDPVGESVDLTRSALEQMVATKQLIAKEKREWNVDKELLQDRIELVQGQIDDLRGSIEESKANAAEALSKLDELKAEDAELTEASSGLASIVADLEARTKDLVQQLPAPIAELVEPLSQELPGDPAASEESLTKRFPRLLGILNMVGKFHRDIHVLPERITLETGDAAEVNAMYLGLGPAFYATADGVHAGTGEATEDGWIWTPAAEADVAGIAQAIGIYRKTAGAGFARIPLTIR